MDHPVIRHRLLGDRICQCCGRMDAVSVLLVQDEMNWREGAVFCIRCDLA